MIIPIPWHSADICLKNSTSVWSLVDKCPSFTRMVTEYHGFIFLVGRFNRFFNCLMITSILWHSAVIRVKKLWHLCESLSTCKLTRIVAEHHGFLFLVCQFNGISQFSQDYIFSVILRDYPCEKTRTSVWKSLKHGRTVFRLMCLCVRPLTCAASCVAYTSKP